MVTTFDPSASPGPGSAAHAETPRRPTRRLTMWPEAWLICLVAHAAACTSVQVVTGSTRITPDELLAGTVLGVAGTPPAAIAQEADVLAVSPEMRAFLDKHVDRKGSDSLKLRQVVSAIIEESSFGLVYDDRTRTASETFHARVGNCLSFSTMFLAMARDVGLKVKFQEVDIPPDWTLDNETYVLNQHVNVHVDLGQAGVRVVDFNIADFKSSYEMRTISDARGLAHYYNNIGVERMQAGDTASALVCFRMAVSVAQEEQPVAKEKLVAIGTLIPRPAPEGNSSDSRGAIAGGEGQFSPTWTNLGTLYLRNGHPAHAEAAYLQAVKANPSDLVAMSDLARLYERMGDQERAAAYRKRVIDHRYLNPYCRYELARQAYVGKDFDAAIRHLKYAIRKRPKEDSFYFLLGLSYLGKGDARAARHWFDRAEEVAAGDTLKRRYSSKVDTLLRGGGDHS